MDGFKNYLFGVILVCFLAALVKSAAGRFRIGKTLDFACALLILLTILKPIARIDARDLSASIGKILSRTENAERESRAYNARITADVIKEKTEAYIWDKAVAEHFNAKTITVEMQYGSTYPYASAVELTGPFTDSQKMRISEWIASALAIPEDRQQWHWSKS